MNHKKLLKLLLVLGIVVVVASACGMIATPTPRVMVELAEDHVAYVRVSESKTVTNDIEPVGENFQLKFGDEVSLVQWDNRYNVWLVSKDGQEGWLYSFYLTGDKSELDFLTEIDRIPKTMSYIYIYDEDGKVYTQGYYTKRLSLSFNSSGGGSATPSGLSVISEGNAVIFDDDVAQMDPPYMPMQCGEKPCELSSDRMYYIISVDSEDNASYECLDLRTLSKCDE